MTEFDCTVVVLTCDRPDLLSQALDGLSRQNLPPASVLVSDDSEGYASQLLVDRYPLLPIVYRKGPRAGQSANLRGALAMVSSEFVVVLHDDDWWEPKLLASARAAFDIRPSPDMFVPGMRFVDVHGTPLDRATAEFRRRRAAAFPGPLVLWKDAATRAHWLLERHVLAVFQGTVFRRSVLRDWLEGPSRGDLDDLWLCAELSRPSSQPLRCAAVPELLCNYRVHGQSVASNAGTYMDSSIAAFQVFRDDPDFASIRTVLAKRVRERAYQSAVQQAALGDRSRAHALLSRHCPRPRSVRERLLATAIMFPTSGLLRRVIVRRNDRFRVEG